jgi:hypothetical protein
MHQLRHSSAFFLHKFGLGCRTVEFVLPDFSSLLDSQSAIEEQRYQDASRLTRLAGTSLVINKYLFTDFYLLLPFDLRPAFSGSIISSLKHFL